MLLNIILIDSQQYRTFLAQVIQFFVSPEKCENQRIEFLTPVRQNVKKPPRVNNFCAKIWTV